MQFPTWCKYLHTAYFPIVFRSSLTECREADIRSKTPTASALSTS